MTTQTQTVVTYQAAYMTGTEIDLCAEHGPWGGLQVSEACGTTLGPVSHGQHRGTCEACLEERRMHWALVAFGDSDHDVGTGLTESEATRAAHAELRRREDRAQRRGTTYRLHAYRTAAGARDADISDERVWTRVTL